MKKEKIKEKIKDYVDGYEVGKKVVFRNLYSKLRKEKFLVRRDIIELEKMIRDEERKD